MCTRSADRWRESLLLVLLVSVAALLRGRHWVGFGLGDDPFYAYTSNLVVTQGLGALDLSFGSNYRVGIWIPIALSFRTLGISEVSFPLFAWLGSLLLVVVVYGLARRLFGRVAAIFAAGAQAVSTFDLAFASTMTIDLPASCLLATSLWLFLEGERASRGRNLALHGLAAFCVLWAYLIKLPALAILLAPGAYTLLHLRRFRRHAGFYAFMALLLTASFALDLGLTGDPLHYLRRELDFAPAPQLFTNVAWLYPDWMFRRQLELGAWLFGPHFWATALAAAWCLTSPRRRHASALPLLWLTTQFLFFEFFPSGWELPYRVTPRFFRYTHAFIAPGSLLIGACLGELWTRRRLWTIERRGKASAALAVGLLAYAAGSIAEGWRIAERYRGHYEDERFAARLLAASPSAPLYSDHRLYDRFNFETGYRRMGDPRWRIGGLYVGHPIDAEDFHEPLSMVREGYVVLGGSRGIDHPPVCILEQGAWQPPDSWTLVASLESPLDAHRQEPLRVYTVGLPAPAAGGGVTRAEP